MPRKAREKSESGIYHIMIRGVNRETIFEDDEDRKKFDYACDWKYYPKDTWVGGLNWKQSGTAFI